MRTTTFFRRGATPLGDLGALAPVAARTTAVRVGLALALAATLAATVLLARSAGSGRAAVLPEGVKTGVIVLDMSASLSGPTYERVATVLRGLVAANQAMGLVMFSDVAYQLLPPNSPTSALDQFVRFFIPQRIIGGSPTYTQTPWGQFSGGTRISRGLAAGAAALRRAHITHGALLLLSDLDDPSADTEPLIAEALALRREHIPVRIVPLGARTENIDAFASLFGRSSFVSPGAFRTTSQERVQPITAASPWGLLALGCVLVALLGANERFNSRLRPEVGT